MNNLQLAFLRGFEKAAQSQGFSLGESVDLLKHASGLLPDGAYELEAFNPEKVHELVTENPMPSKATYERLKHPPTVPRPPSLSTPKTKHPHKVEVPNTDRPELYDPPPARRPDAEEVPPLNRPAVREMGVLPRPPMLNHPEKVEASFLKRLPTLPFLKTPKLAGYWS